MGEKDMTNKPLDELPEDEYEETLAELRLRAAENLGAEFGTDVSEWLV
jgi:hypothetical protein